MTLDINENQRAMLLKLLRGSAAQVQPGAILDGPLSVPEDVKDLAAKLTLKEQNG